MVVYQEIYIDRTMHIYGNQANANGSYSNEDKKTDSKYNENYWNGGKKGQEGYKGEDIFGAQEVEVVGAFSTGTAAKWTGIIHNGSGVETFDKSTAGSLKTNQWILLKANPESTAGLDSRPVTIKNNTSNTHGAGVLINGWLVSGSYTNEHIGDYLSIEGTKSFVDLDGKTQQQFNDQFSFGVYRTGENTPVAVGRSDSNGKISFPDAIYLTDEQRTSGTATFTYELRELSDNLSGDILIDSTIYELSIDLTTGSSEEFYKPVWNEQKKCYESKKVTTYRHYVSRVGYRKKEKSSWNYQQFSSGESPKIVKPSGNTTTFENTLVPVKDIEVSKQWVGTEESEQKEIQAQLQYRIKDSNNEYVNYGEPVTLKSPDWFYRWNDVPTQNAQKDYLEYRVKELEVPTGFISELVEGETRTEDRTTSGSVMKTVWAPISEFSTDTKYLIISDDHNAILKLQNTDGVINEINQESTGTIPANYKTVDTNQNIVYEDGISSLGTLFTVGSNTNLSGKKGTLLRLYSNEHIWLIIRALNSETGLKTQWTNEYSNDSWRQGLAVDSEGYLSVGYDNSFTKVTFFNGCFGTSSSTGASPVTIYAQQERKVPSSTTKSVTVQTFTLTNTKQNYKLEIKKIDKDDREKLLDGAEFSLYQGRDTQNLELIATGKTVNGSITFEGLDPGYYWLKETKQPDGYQEPSQNYIPVTIATSNEPTVLKVQTVENELIKYELPETGSTGTKIYTATGTILLLTGTSLYRYKRRRRRKGGEAH